MHIKHIRRENMLQPSRIVLTPELPGGVYVAFNNTQEVYLLVTPTIVTKLQVLVLGECTIALRDRVLEPQEYSDYRIAQNENAALVHIDPKYRILLRGGGLSHLALPLKESIFMQGVYASFCKTSRVLDVSALCTAKA